MSEIERLAQLLHPITCSTDEFACSGYRDHAEEAAQLAALGVRVGVPDAAPEPSYSGVPLSAWNAAARPSPSQEEPR